MPRVPRPRKKPSAETLASLTEFQRMDLTLGYGFFDEYETLEEMTAVWELVEDEIMDQWCAERPGERPYAWWLLTHKLERPIIGAMGDEYVARRRREARFGYLNTHVWGQGGYLQQPQTEYLIEHDLLLPGELERFTERQLRENADAIANFQKWKDRHEPNDDRKLAHFEDE